MVMFSSELLPLHRCLAYHDQAVALDSKLHRQQTRAAYYRSKLYAAEKERDELLRRLSRKRTVSIATQTNAVTPCNNVETQTQELQPPVPTSGTSGESVMASIAQIESLTAATRHSLDPLLANIKSQYSQLQNRVRELERSNAEMKAEMAVLDDDFFDEIEELKFQHQQSKQRLERYQRYFGPLPPQQ